MATNDITPIRSSTDEPMPLVLAVCNLALTVWLSVAIAWLLLRHERQNVRRSVRHLKSNVARVARRCSMAAMQRRNSMFGGSVAALGAPSHGIALS